MVVSRAANVRVKIVRAMIRVVVEMIAGVIVIATVVAVVTVRGHSALSRARWIPLRLCCPR